MVKILFEYLSNDYSNILRRLFEKKFYRKLKIIRIFLIDYSINYIRLFKRFYIKLKIIQIYK